MNNAGRSPCSAITWSTAGGRMAHWRASTCIPRVTADRRPGNSCTLRVRRSALAKLAPGFFKKPLANVRRWRVRLGVSGAVADNSALAPQQGPLVRSGIDFSSKQHGAVRIYTCSLCESSCISSGEKLTHRSHTLTNAVNFAPKMPRKLAAPVRKRASRAVPQRALLGHNINSGNALRQTGPQSGSLPDGRG